MWQIHSNVVENRCEVGETESFILDKVYNISITENFYYENTINILLDFLPYNFVITIERFSRHQCEVSLRINPKY